MAFKFFNIGKANEEIDRLESSVAELTKDREALKGNTGEIESAAEKIKTDLAAANQKVTQLESDVSTARTSIGTLTAEKASLTAELAAENAKLANPEARIKEAASMQAAEITAKLGQPPVSTMPGKPGEEPAKPVTGRDRFLSTIKIEGQK